MAGTQTTPNPPVPLARQRPVQPYSGPDAVSLWILACCVMVFAMVLLGGYTRLTRSGLSMVEWKPFSVVPPMTDAEWTAEFERYQGFPEFQIQNRDMTVDGFRSIYMVEYSHRMLGRALGFVFLIPYLWFWRRKRLDRPLRRRLLAVFALGGAQGVMGWYMVKSGLVDDPRVSPYRLTAHLLLAFLIQGWLISIVFGRIWPIDRGRPVDGPAARLLPHARLVLVLVVVMVASGGLVAGNHAGLSYNTFPTMNGQVVPDGLLAMTPAWENVFENPTTVQFNHRVMFVVITAAIVALWVRARFLIRVRSVGAVDLLLFALVVQVSLGIVTLLHAVPVPLGVLHQGGAFVVFTLALMASHRLREEAVRGSSSQRPPEPSKMSRHDP